MKRYPFKFLDAYGKADHDIFFGREEEVDALYRMVFQTNLLLVYGASGTGKTSLIRCGLSNRFKTTQWLDLYIRRGNDLNQSLLETVRKRLPEQAAPAMEATNDLEWFEQLVEAEGSSEGEEAYDLAPNADDSEVAQALRSLYLATFTPVYLIFDQFEELYTLGTEPEQRQFIATVEELVRLPLPLKILIVMREEYLANLYALERAVPQLRNKKLRLAPMDLPRVQQVILSATVKNPHSNIELVAGHEAAIAEAITDKIRERSIDVKLPYLQVFMDRLYREATGLETARDQPAQFTLLLIGRMGNISDVLRDFLDQQSQQIYRLLAANHPRLPTDLVWRMLSPFATVDGTKIPLSEAEVMQSRLPLASYPMSPELIRRTISELENRRILRYRPEEDVYELAHDTLAQQVAEKRSEEETAFLKAERLVTDGYLSFLDTNTYLSREQLAYIRPYEATLRRRLDEEQEEFLRRSKRRRQSQRITLWAIIGLAFIAALLAIYLISAEQKRTEEQKKAAEVEKEKAKEALAKFEYEQAERERNELLNLLDDAAQIGRSGTNCPPPSMRQQIDSLYARRKELPAVVEQYTSVMEEVLKHCH